MEIILINKEGQMQTYSKERFSVRDLLAAITYEEKSEERQKRLLLTEKAETESVEEDFEPYGAADVKASYKDGASFLVEFYGSQFTTDEVIDGLSVEQFRMELNKAIQAASGGEAEEKKERK